MSVIHAGFGDTVHDSQYCFRQLLTAMSQPGTFVDLNLVQGFGDMMDASTQILLALADSSTPVWLSTQFEHDEVAKANLSFHLGVELLISQQEDSQKKASFALIGVDDMAKFDWAKAQFYVGNEEYPDRSTTVIVEVSGLSDQATNHPLSSQSSSPCMTLRLSGSGIEGESLISIESNSSQSLQAMLSHRKNNRFPLGLDFILVCGSKVVALPRSTKVEIFSCM